MPTWPRVVLPRQVSEFSYPPALKSRSQSGVWNTRSNTNVGRVWAETYFGKGRDNDFRQLFALARQYWREGTFFDIDHRLYLTPKGVGGGSPLVAGASQTGSNINVDAAPLSTTNWLRAGDIVKFAGINLVYDITANVNTDGGGLATLPISPEIFSGNSPADNAAVTITAVLMRVILVQVEMPVMGPDEFGITKLTFAEAP